MLLVVEGMMGIVIDWVHGSVDMWWWMCSRCWLHVNPKVQV